METEVEDEEELQRAISRSISRAEREAGLSTPHVISNIPVQQIKFVKNDVKIFFCTNVLEMIYCGVNLQRKSKSENFFFS